LGFFSLKRRFLGDLIAPFQYIKGACNKDRERLFRKGCSDWTRGNIFWLKEGRFRLKKEIFYHEGSETLEEDAQRSSRCPIPGSIQGQVHWGFEQPDVVKDVPTHDSEVGLVDLQRSLSNLIVL